MEMTYDVIIIGAGASGLMCAREASRRGRKVIVFDHAGKVGSKLLVSGGGRCNFTNTQSSPANFLSANPHFTKSALSRFSPNDFIALLDERGIRYVEKTPGQLFCRENARTIIELLRTDCERGGVKFLLSCKSCSVEREKLFAVATSVKTYRSGSLVIATGGLSFPKLGATSFGYDIARQFELPVMPLSPGLVPLTLSGKDLQLAAGLAGISLRAAVSIKERVITDMLLFVP